MEAIFHWNDLISKIPGSHLLQTWEWGEFKSYFGWHPFGYVWFETSPGLWKSSRVEFTPKHISTGSPDALPYGYAKYTEPTLAAFQPQAAALILQRTLSIRGFAARIRILYSPKGPLLDWGNASLRNFILDDLEKIAKQNSAIFIKIDPDVRLGLGVPGQPDASNDLIGQEVIAELTRRGWQFSAEQIQFRNTVHINLLLSEAELLNRMKSKTRYNIRLAQRKGVTIRVGSQADWDMLYRMYAGTSLRDGFVIREEKYYKTLWSLFSRQPFTQDHSLPELEILIAETEGDSIAAVVIYRFAGKAYYLSGMSMETHREKMPNHLLQWEAIHRAKAAGCTLYDMWGAPDQFTSNDTMWGVYRFKEGFTGDVVRTLGAWDHPTRKIAYHIYSQILPRVLDVMRRRGISRTKQITP